MSQMVPRASQDPSPEVHHLLIVTPCGSPSNTLSTEFSVRSNGHGHTAMIKQMRLTALSLSLVMQCVNFSRAGQ